MNNETKQTTQKELTQYQKKFILTLKNSSNEIDKFSFGLFEKSLKEENYNIDFLLTDTLICPYK